MYGNLSKTIVSVPKSFHLSSHITNNSFGEKKYKEPMIYDTFSYLKKINIRHKNRYFRLSEHFKENSPYTDLNFNNNKRYISPIAELKPSMSLNFFLFGNNAGINKKIRKSISSLNLSKTTNKENTKDNFIETHSSQNMNNSIKGSTNQFKQGEFDLIEEKKDLSKINEVLPVDENTKNNNIDEEIKSKYEDEDEKENLQKYIKKLIKNRPHNLKELKNYLNIKYADETKPNNILPKIGKVPNSISQDDLFKKTINLKLASLTMIRPEVKEGIFKRKKNMILKRDFDMIRKIYNVRKKLPFHLRNIISYEALVQD